VCGAEARKDEWEEVWWNLIVAKKKLADRQ
jgi:hypothetical protein